MPGRSGRRWPSWGSTGGACAILLTHVHGDHSGGAEAMRAATGAKVYAGAGDAAVLRAGGPREAFFSTFSHARSAPHPTTVDVELRGGETIAVGDVRIQAIAAPGHTPGSVCYLVERHGLRGPVRGRCDHDAPGRRAAPHRGGQAAGHLFGLPAASISRARPASPSPRSATCAALPVPDLVLPGHPARRPGSRRLRDSRKPNGNHARRGASATWKRCWPAIEADGANFLDGNPKRLLPDLDYLGDFGGSAVYGFSAGSRYFLVDAPGGAGLVAVRERAAPTARPGADGPGRGPAHRLRCQGNRRPQGAGRDVALPGRRRLGGRSGDPDPRVPAGTDILPAEELAATGWFPVATIPVGGQGHCPHRLSAHLAGTRSSFCPAGSPSG